MPIPLKTKTFVLKPKVILVISKTKKAPPPKETEILLPMISRSVYYAINRVKVLHTPHQFYKTKYIPCKSPKIPLKPAFMFLFSKDNLVNLLCKSIVNYEKNYRTTLNSFNIFYNFSPK
jgi:hypothetical protein